MKLRTLTIKNYRAFGEETTIPFHEICCLVGKNDVGKSTVLKAVRLMLTDEKPSYDDICKSGSSSTDIYISARFEVENKCWIGNGSEPTILKKGDVVLYEKHWKFPTVGGASKLEIGISIIRGEGIISVRKNCYKEILSLLPSFEYFPADCVLDESSTVYQKYFKAEANNFISSYLRKNNSKLEIQLKNRLQKMANNMSASLGAYFCSDSAITVNVGIDWSKVVTVSFDTSQGDDYIPLKNRGDGLRRATMLSLLETLAAEGNTGDRIYAFEEPETYLHPSLQEQMAQYLIEMSHNGSQIMLTTHSPSIVAMMSLNNLVHVVSEKNHSVKVILGNDATIASIIKDLGITNSSPVLSAIDTAKLIFLVEGKDDVSAINHVSEMYRKAGKIDKSFEELGVVLIPVGGCDAVSSWSSFNIIGKLNKPYFIMLDSDRKSNDLSPNEEKLKRLGLPKKNIHVTKKREIENYFPVEYFKRIGISDIAFGDFDDVKKLCAIHSKSKALGGKHVCEKHFCHLTYEDLRVTFCPTGNEADDEFLEIYDSVTELMNNL